MSLSFTDALERLARGDIVVGRDVPLASGKYREWIAFDSDEELFQACRRGDRALHELIHPGRPARLFVDADCESQDREAFDGALATLEARVRARWPGTACTVATCHRAEKLSAHVVFDVWFATAAEMARAARTLFSDVDVVDGQVYSETACKSLRLPLCQGLDKNGKPLPRMQLEREDAFALALVTRGAPPDLQAREPVPPPAVDAAPEASAFAHALAVKCKAWLERAHARRTRIKVVQGRFFELHVDAGEFCPHAGRAHQSNSMYLRCRAQGGRLVVRGVCTECSPTMGDFPYLDEDEMQAELFAGKE